MHLIDHLSNTSTHPIQALLHRLKGMRATP
jgi:hypothetical protein